MSKIYTKTGDKGTTSNFLDKRYSKADIEIELVGSIDEINANIGYLRSKIENKQYSSEFFLYVDSLLKEIQYHLYQIGIEISTEFTEVHITEEAVTFLEQQIDKMTAESDPLTSFIYYSGSETSTYSQVLRSVTRRGERVFVRALQGKDFPQSYLYINRLSDFFFTLARYLNSAEKIKDEPMLLR